VTGGTPGAPFRITICGIDELPDHGAAGVTHIVSILDPEWPEPAAFARFDPHRRIDLRFHDVIDPMPGWVMPHQRDIERLLEFGRELGAAPAAAETHLLVHCHAGVSRSTAAAVLIMAQECPDRPVAAALAAVLAIRPRAWPNLRLLELGDALLGRNGEIIAAARDFYRRALEREPLLAETMIDGGRAREIWAALGR